MSAEERFAASDDDGDEARAPQPITPRPEPPPTIAGGWTNVDASGYTMLDDEGYTKIRKGPQCGDCACIEPPSNVCPDLTLCATSIRVTITGFAWHTVPGDEAVWRISASCRLPRTAQGQFYTETNFGQVFVSEFSRNGEPMDFDLFATGMIWRFCCVSPQGGGSVDCLMVAPTHGWWVSQWRLQWATTGHVPNYAGLIITRYAKPRLETEGCPPQSGYALNVAACGPECTVVVDSQGTCTVA
jgi:hypothetical protein